MNFPHLKDTAYPYIETVDPYAFAATFDYTRWNEDTKVKLVNVRWNSDYADVVKFENDAKRDAWFDAINESYVVELAQAARIIPEKYVKLPIPYDVMARYNYLYIEMPIAPNSKKPLDYENSSGIRRWYFFIDSIEYGSPNSTRAYLTLDVWTNFANDVEINYMLLERGHAPVSASDTNTYLDNPISNNKYLLAPDVNFDNASITRKNTYVPFGNGEKCVCIASTCAPSQIGQLGTVYEDPNYSPTHNITYSDTGERWGHQLNVHGFTIGNGYDFSEAKAPAFPVTSDEFLIANNLSVYAIDAVECFHDGTFFKDVMKMCPQFLNTVKACFVVDKRCVTYQSRYTIAGHFVYRCVGNNETLLTQNLTQNDFNFPTELRRFAKLYTSPYSKLEITDNDGTTYEVNIEETSTLSVKAVTAVAFPYINYRVFVDGIGGVGSQSYSWRNLRNETSDRNISNSDWFKYCFDWDIPTFALYMDAETAWNLNNFNRGIRMGKRNALVAYHNSMRSANTACENALAIANTALENVNASTDTAKTNANNSASAAQTNAYNSADTSKTNTDNAADAAYDNVVDKCKNDYDNADYAMDQSVTKYVHNCDNAVANLDESLDDETDAFGAQMSTAAAVQGIDADVNAQLSFMSGISGIGTGIANGAVAGPAGAVAGALGGVITAVTDMASQAVLVAARADTWDVQWREGFAHHTYHRARANQIQTNNNNEGAYNLNLENAVALLTLATTHNMQKKNAGRTRTMEKTNATLSQTTAKTNADNTYNATTTNAANTFTTDRENAVRTKDTSFDTSGYTRDVAEANAKEILENAANGAMAGMQDAASGQPVSIGVTNGNPAPDYMRTRGLQIKVKTQSDSAIRQTGDVFARFGYALNQVWNVGQSGLCLMRYFTYWKAADIWVNDKAHSNNRIQNMFADMFKNGITIWSDPTKIGKVSVYDN